MTRKLLKLLRSAATTFAICTAALASASASKALTLTAAYLNIDGSGSISASDFQLQKNAYVNLLSGVRTDGSIALGVLQFSSSVADVFGLTLIDSVAKRDNLLASLNAMTQNRGSTALGPGIEFAATSLTTSFACDDTEVNCLIDASTDGFGNTGINQVTAAANAVASGVDQVNCLGVGPSANCNFVAGTDAFAVTADSFNDFQRALRTKLATEGIVDRDPGNNTSAVPLPAAGWFLIVALGGLTALSRRKAAL